MLLARFRSFFFWLWVNHFCWICVHLLLVYHSTQLSHTRSDFSRLVRVMISATRILFHFILVFLSWTLMKHLTCSVGIFLLYVFRVWIFSGRDLFQITETDSSCVLCIICSQFVTFEQVMLCSAYCPWFVALSASPYAVLLRTFPYLFLAQFHGSLWVLLTCAKLALRTVIMSFHRWLSLLLRLKVIASI